MGTTKESVIHNMCLTYNHAYCLPTKDDNNTDPFDCALTASEKEYILRQMTQLFENNIEPYMEFKNG